MTQKSDRTLRAGEMPEQPSLETWRRRLRISVRGLIALVLLVGGWLGWIGHEARVQRQAVTAIERAVGSVQYDRELPRWLGAVIGIDTLSNVVSVSLARTDMSELTHGGHIPEVTDPVLAPLA